MAIVFVTGSTNGLGRVAAHSLLRDTRAFVRARRNSRRARGAQRGSCGRRPAERRREEGPRRSGECDRAHDAVIYNAGV